MGSMILGHVTFGNKRTILVSIIGAGFSDSLTASVSRPLMVSSSLLIACFNAGKFSYRISKGMLYAH